MARIHTALKRGGILVGQFYGDKDSWNVVGDYRTYYTEKDVRLLFSDSGFKILHFNSEESNGISRLGKTKHKHVIHFIVRK